MLFTTPIFLFLFLPLLLSAYYLVHEKFLPARNFIALIGSVIFFAWGEPIFVFFLLASTYLDYKISLAVAPENAMKQEYKKLLLTMAIAYNVLVLISSKYLNFIFAELADLHINTPKINLPLFLGISFITFHKVSYLVDSYKGRAIPPRNFFDCALYIFLFPQLIAGPIIRYHDIGAQIHHRQHSVEAFLTGFFRFSVGLSKKLLIADPLSHVADQVFALPTEEISCLVGWSGIVAYTLQIYFDFSGYSDMAIGMGRMMGFRFPENFNWPYLSRSITEFWRRWHISLSNWMRLYLYIPLGGNRVSTVRIYFNLWIVFLISGFWHGASWNFIAWGAYYGFFLCLERAVSSSHLFKNTVLPDRLCHILTMLIVMIGWVLFRSPSLTYAGGYIATLFGFGHTNLDVLPWGLMLGNHELFIMAIASLFAYLALPRSWLAYLKMTSYGIGVMSFQFITTLFLLILSAAAMVSSDYIPFLYFRF